MVTIFIFFVSHILRLYRLRFQPKGIVIHSHLVKFDFRIQLLAGV